ncbi:hypothetical protein [Trichocoleus sp. FACHB-40]|nr:hypothetical protein [Trichocoleus sp. FACHB-40]
MKFQGSDRILPKNLWLWLPLKLTTKCLMSGNQSHNLSLQVQVI